LFFYAGTSVVIKVKETYRWIHPMQAPLRATDGGGAGGYEAGVPGGGDSVAIVIISIHKSRGKVFWWLWIDYEVVFIRVE
jgi:hypothetical protein